LLNKRPHPLPGALVGAAGQDVGGQPRPPVLTADKVTGFIDALRKKPTKNNADAGPASARTKDTYRGAVHAFAQWCVDTRTARPYYGWRRTAPDGDEEVPG
jgi:hypothetical protein